MRQIFQLPLFIGIVLLGACKPSRNHSSGPFTGKVIGNICSHYTIQLIEGDMDPARYLKTWKNDMTDSVYHNVFSVANYCYFNTQNLQQGDVFQFNLIADSAVQNCVVCLIYEPTPSIANTIRVIHTNK